MDLFGFFRKKPPIKEATKPIEIPAPVPVDPMVEAKKLGDAIVKLVGAAESERIADSWHLQPLGLYENKHRRYVYGIYTFAYDDYSYGSYTNFEMSISVANPEGKRYSVFSLRYISGPYSSFNESPKGGWLHDGPWQQDVPLVMEQAFLHLEALKHAREERRRQEQVAAEAQRELEIAALRGHVSLNIMSRSKDD